MGVRAGVGVRVVAACLAIVVTASAPAWAAFPQDPPNDPLFDASPLPNATNEQWDLASPAVGFDRGISADRAWPLATGAGTTIADVDVGVQLDHPDLAGSWWRGFDFYARDGDPTSDTSNEHGTNVAGVLGAGTNNGQGVAAVAPGSRVIPIRTADNILHQGARVGQGIVYATDLGADAISMSLGTDTFSSSLRRAVGYAYRRGAVVAIASGNEFHFHHHYPQVMDEVLAVGGVTPDSASFAARNEALAIGATDFDVHASYSDYGPHLDVVAPTQTPTTTWGGGYRKTWDGTSTAAPHVAAVAALVKSRARAVGLRLSAGEVVQIVRQTADDLADRAKGYAPGWDVMSGWGRVNAYGAVRRVEPGRIPPDANIRTPDWYRPLRGRTAVRATVDARSAVDWVVEIGAGQQPTEWRRLASGHGSRRTRIAPAAVDARRLGPGGYTLRLRATDANGNLGEDRAYFEALGDRALKRGFPKALGTSGEASPALADLDRDGAADIVLATSDGLVRVYSGRSGRMLRGWPRAMRAAGGSGAAARRIGTVRSGFLATPAIGDVAGDRRPEVLAAGLDGRLYAWTARGRRLHGFPFRIALHRPAEQGRLDAAIYASPALADLDGDRKLDAVFGAADQRIYAVKGNGRVVPGWPVLARDGGDAAKILSSPAVGDLDGDRRPDVVEGTAEVYGQTPAQTGRVHAFSASGKPLPGWPVAPQGVAADAIPLAGEGVPVSPSLADVDGDGRDEVAVAAFTGQIELYRGDGSRVAGTASPNHFQGVGRGASSRSGSPGVLAVGANAAFGRTAAGGPLRLFGGAIDDRVAAAQGSPANRLPFEHVLGGWDAASGDWLSAFPIPVEGWQTAAAPAIADVDGDGRSEVVAGSSGNVLHAFREDGTEPGGWPKHTSGWLIAGPAVGDVDGDRRLEVVAVTRDGYLFAWDTPSRASAPRDWPSFRHDRRNSGRWPGPLSDR